MAWNSKYFLLLNVKEGTPTPININYPIPNWQHKTGNAIYPYNCYVF
jgi:hypothetical protein